MARKRNKIKYPNPYLKVGTKVRSYYAARWTGYVVELSGQYNHNVVRCRITHDRNGNPMRKTFLSMWLDTYWLEVLEIPKDNKEKAVTNEVLLVPLDK